MCHWKGSLIALTKPIVRICQIWHQTQDVKLLMINCTSIIDRYLLDIRAETDHLNMAGFSGHIPNRFHTHTTVTVQCTNQTCKHTFSINLCHRQALYKPLFCGGQMSSVWTTADWNVQFMHCLEERGESFVSTALVVCLSSSMNFNQPCTGVINKPFHGIHTNM